MFIKRPKLFFNLYLKSSKVMQARTMSNPTGRMARVISAKVRLSGRTDKPKSEILTIEEFERRAKDGTL